MSANLTDYGANAFADHLSGVTALPASYYVALCTAQPDVGTDGTALAALEPVGGAYARVLLGRTAVQWAAADQGVSTIQVTVTFPTATLDWGTISHYALCTALTAGSVYGYGEFTYPQLVASGDTMVIPVGGISLAFVGPTNPMVI